MSQTPDAVLERFHEKENVFSFVHQLPAAWAHLVTSDLLECFLTAEDVHAHRLLLCFQLLRLPGSYMSEEEGAEGQNRLARLPREMWRKVPKKRHQKPEVQRHHLRAWGELQSTVNRLWAARFFFRFKHLFQLWLYVVWTWRTTGQILLQLRVGVWKQGFICVASDVRTWRAAYRHIRSLKQHMVVEHRAETLHLLWFLNEVVTNFYLVFIILPPV